MAENQSAGGQERTEEATPRRLEEARRKGNVVRSRELATTAMLMSAACAMFVVGPALADDVLSIAREAFTHAQVHRGREIDVFAAFRDALAAGIASLAPFLALMAVAAFLAPMSIGGWAFSAEALGPKWDKLDPLRGIARMFSVRALMELLKALAKFLVVTAGALLLLWAARGHYLALGYEGNLPGIAHATWLIAIGFLALSATTLLIALADVPFQLWNHARQLRMTRQEVRDEFKETEGKPEVKSRIRQIQREIATRRMMEAVPLADVVVTNPTHYAVALRYDANRMRAPRVVARGADEIAARIRAVAQAHSVPMLRAPSLARAVYHSTRLDQEIPAGLYQAVAQVLAYVYRVRDTWRARGGELPPLGDELPIPDELKVSE